MVYRGLRPRKTHDLEELVAEMGIEVPGEILIALRSLSALVWQTPYPDWDEPTDFEIERYTFEHNQVVDWLNCLEGSIGS